MFYELNTQDPLGTNPWKRDVNDFAAGTFEGTENQLAQIARLMDPDAKLSEQALVVESTDSIASTKMALFSTASLADIMIPNLLPDG